ncbi:MAG: NAD(+) diphosphatase [Leptolyngbyaceae bacterium]|nr:NAD(+) diphosphatase [Leptolyngbyaceae bacterium]
MHPINPFRPPATFIPQVAPPESPPACAWWFVFVGDRLLVKQEGEKTTLPQALHLKEWGLAEGQGGLHPGEPTQFLGWLEGVGCYAAELDKEALRHPPTGYHFEKLRLLYGVLDDDVFAIAGRAIQIVTWNRNHLFCGHCGTPMMQHETERAKHCPSCGLRNYPRLSPAVIMLVARGEEVLLARAPRFRPGMYSVLAGFVEPGESLEETVAREVREEVGVEVTNIRYFGSQPWPFPHSLMIGFMTDYAGGEIVIDEVEIEAAAWFHKTALPPVPGPLSIARKLIEAFVAGQS